MRSLSTILFLLILVALACGSSDVALPTAPAATRLAPSEPIPLPPVTPSAAPDLPQGQSALVTRIIDGDTIDVDIQGAEYRVRYIGIDTPERDMPYYVEATEANRRLVQGQTVLLVKDVSETDRYGRLLRYIYLPDGTFVNAELVQAGYAQAATFPPDVAFADFFRQLQEEARQAGRGLWAD
ncbi:MAG: thermonuclease family protein [Chloroflexota bacterium]|jgi:endonuclease YncB( thermonuclease family)